MLPSGFKRGCCDSKQRDRSQEKKKHFVRDRARRRNCRCRPASRAVSSALVAQSRTPPLALAPLCVLLSPPHHGPRTLLGVREDIKHHEHSVAEELRRSGEAKRNKTDLLQCGGKNTRAAHTARKLEHTLLPSKKKITLKQSNRNPVLTDGNLSRGTRFLVSWCHRWDWTHC